MDGREAIVTGASHAKYATIDGTIAIVGNLVVDSAAIVAAWDGQLFEPDFTRAVVVEQCADR